MRRVDVAKPERRVAVLCCAAAVLAGLMAVGCASADPAGGPSAPVPGRPVPAAVLPRLTAIADRAAREHGGAVPAWVSVVVTTHQKALTSATPGDTVTAGEKTAVYLVTMKGHFTAEMAPPGGQAPTGTYLSLVINARTFQGLDLGLSSKLPPVVPDSLGPVTYLRVGTAIGHCAKGTGFAMSLAPDRHGQRTPVAAAVWFAGHGGVAGIPHSGWRVTSQNGAAATVESGSVTLHVVQGPDKTWQVDSGQRCS
jgi:hypothetical protein